MLIDPASSMEILELTSASPKPLDIISADRSLAAYLSDLLEPTYWKNAIR